MDALSTGAVLLIAGCVIPWLLLEGLFFVRMKKRHGGAVPPAPDPASGDTP